MTSPRERIGNESGYKRDKDPGASPGVPETTGSLLKKKSQRDTGTTCQVMSGKTLDGYGGSWHLEKKEWSTKI